MSARGDLVKFTGPAGIKAKAEPLAKLLKAAHKMPFTRNDVDKLAHMIGVHILANCPACSTGTRCDEHHPGTALERLALDPGAHASDPVSEHQALVDYYYQAFTRARRGKAPKITPLDTRAVKEMRERHGLEESKALVDSMFADPWGKLHGDIQMLNRNPSRFIKDESGQKRGGALQREGV